MLGNTIRNTIFTQGISDSIGVAVGAVPDALKGAYIYRVFTDEAGFGADIDTHLALTGNFAGRGTGLNVSITGTGSSNFTGAVPGGLVGVKSDVELSGLGTVTAATGFYTKIISSGGGTITTGYGSIVDAATAPASFFTNNVGVAIHAQTVGTNNANLLIGTLTPPVGNYSIYNASAEDNYFGGSLVLNDLTVRKVVCTDANKQLVSNSSIVTNGIVYGSASVGIDSTTALTNGQLAIGSTGAAPVAATLTQVANQTSITNGAGSITVGTVQDIGSGSSPTFANITLTARTTGRVAYFTTGGAFTDSANMTFDGNKFSLATSGSGGGIMIGGDTPIYRGGTAICVIAAQITNSPPSNTTTSGSAYGLLTSTTAAPSGATSGRTYGLSFTATASTNNNYTDGTGGITGFQGAVSHSGSGTITAAACGIFYGESTSTGTITLMNHVYVLGHDVSSGATITTWNGVRVDTPRGSGAGTITTGFAFVCHPRTFTGTAITSMTGFGVFPNSNWNAITANGQTRIGIDFGSLPTAGAFTGCTTVAIRFASGTTARDGLLWGSDTNLYRFAANNLGTDDKFTAAGGLQVGSSSTVGQALTASDTAGNVAFTSIVNKHHVTICLCGGFTPAGTGADVAEFVVPYSPRDGTTSLTYNVRRIDVRVNVAGGAPAVTLEKYTGTGAFSATSIGTVTLGSGAYEANKTSSFTTSTLTSGDKVRFNVGTLGTATGWTIQLLLEGT